MQSQEANPGSANQITRRFRKRIVPAILLLLFSGFGLLGVSIYTYRVISLNVEYRFVAPNDDLLNSANERLANPRHIAAGVFGTAACILGLMASVAWMRGNWTSAILRTIWCFICFGVTNYVSP